MQVGKVMERIKRHWIKFQVIHDSLSSADKSREAESRR